MANWWLQTVRNFSTHLGIAYPDDWEIWVGTVALIGLVIAYSVYGLIQLLHRYDQQLLDGLTNVNDMHALMQVTQSMESINDTDNAPVYLFDDQIMMHRSQSLHLDVDKFDHTVPEALQYDGNHRVINFDHGLSALKLQMAGLLYLNQFDDLDAYDWQSEIVGHWVLTGRFNQKIPWPRQLYFVTYHFEKLPNAKTAKVAGQYQTQDTKDDDDD